MSRPIRVLIAKPGLDGHDRGALIVAQGLRDEGMEVVYTGLRQTAAQIAAAAIQEDVDCIGLSSLSGAHMTLFPAVVEELRREGADDILVIGGGVIPPDDVRSLEENGFAKIFTPGSTIAEMAAFIRAHGRERTGSAGAAAQDAAQLDHIGIAVRDIDSALRFYRDHLGFRLARRAEVADQDVRVAFLEGDGTRIELLEPLSPGGSVGRFVEKRGEGLHHVAYRVDDVERWLDRARLAGYRLIDEKPRRGAENSWIAFVHPQSAFGVLTEYCQVIQ